MEYLTNSYFNNINIFNHNSLYVEITKKIFLPDLFNLNFNEYMQTSHSNLNNFLIDNQHNSQKIILKQII
ncbi:hypothetical protein ['Fragaria x ananassa' phyllody phytoplasma]|uniref:hypothetical protein n=1 Tax='Fragaria x ananassa' phyllody phytoplasma TaxID=2358428 RepID=UPI001BA6896A|nr:hypothetical protein ['Fragaria x ananassa' phyllody phytoplasma]